MYNQNIDKIIYKIHLKMFLSCDKIMIYYVFSVCKLSQSYKINMDNQRNTP